MISHQFKSSDKRLKQYTAFASCFLLGLTEVNAQFAIYTDLDPDSLIQLEVADTSSWGLLVYRGEIGIDLNRDGENDINRILQEEGSGGSCRSGWIVPAQAAGPFSIATWSISYGSTYGTTTVNRLAKLGPGSLVGSTLNWNNAIQTVFKSPGATFGPPSGPWTSFTTASAGIKFDDGLANYYGWIRMTRESVFDYAINPIPNQAITAWPAADSLTAAAVHSIEPNQITSNGNFSDFNIVFQVPASEAGIASYRIIAVKQDSLPTFDLSSALALPADRFESVLPTGAHFNSLLGTGLKDSDGDDLELNQDYHFLVMSMADSVVTMHPNLWSCSPVVQAKLVSAMAGTPVVSDIADHNDATDIHVSFTKADDETGIAEYRVVLWKEAYTPDLAILSSLPTGQYEPILPTGLDINSSLSAGLLDADGEAIRSHVSYRVFVLSVADGVILTENILSEPSAYFVNELPTRVVQNLLAADVGELDSGADLQVSFDAALDEFGIASYRLFAKASGLSAPTADSLYSLPADRYVEFFPSGGSYSANFDGIKDISGNAICGTCEYGLIALSVGDGIEFLDYTETVDSENILLSAASLEVTAVDLNQVVVAPDASAFEVSFTKAIDETHLASYRVVLSKSSMLPDLADLYTLPVSSFLDVAPTGADITTGLPASLKDYEGDEITFGVAYKAVVLSVADGVGATLWSKSDPSPSEMIDASDFSATNLVVSDAEDYNNWRDIGVSFEAPAGEAYINEYRIYVSEIIVFDSGLAVSDFSPDSYLSILPTGGPYAFDLGAIDFSVDGDSIAGEKTFYAHVVGVLDNNKTTVFETVDLDLDSLRVTALNLSVNDLTGTASDLSLSFTPATKEDRIANHKILLVENTHVDFVSEHVFDELDPNSYFKVEPPVDMPVNGFPELFYSVVTGSLVQGGDYRAFVLSTTTEATNSVKVLSDSSNLVSIIPIVLGVDEEQQAVGYLFYASGSLYIKTGTAQSIPVVITDIKGREIWSSAGVIGSISIDCSAWSKGIYLIKLVDENYPQLLKFSR